ncbi:hypothetical protein [Streptomyces palmae]|uniref:Uncharacterized protein n=1 Tax=Streptomyces palmae TaxID=1701085 RepID=A0A4Z0HG52_9ACTN|nr:hypothetical protein [Streptomyces palmae]TGB19619.1 hypothetical protein E4099_00280 [Streptomyces palmae]
MTFSEEWTGLVAEALSRQPAGTRLDHAEAAPSDTTNPLAVRRDGLGAVGHDADISGTLKVTQGPWTTASRTSGHLARGIADDLSYLAATHEGLAAHAVGLSAVTALSSVRFSWEERLKSIQQECAGLVDALWVAAAQQGEIDGQIGRNLDDAVRGLSTRQG